MKRLLSTLCLLLAACAPAPAEVGGTDSGPTGSPAGTGGATPAGSATTPAGTTTDPVTTDCPPVGPQTRAAVVTDIDETLTTLDSEWLTQIAIPSHDPAMRPDADTLMQTYVHKGYRVFYVTARGESLQLLDGTPARDATEAWLSAHGFPYTTDGVFLAGGLGALGNAAVGYKAGVIEDLQAAGFEIVAAYGNADTDIEAYRQAGLPDEDLYLVGALAGTLGVFGISDEDAYTNALPYVQSLPCGW